MNEYRRFEVIKEENLAKAEELIAKKKLTRQDLELLLGTFKFRKIVDTTHLQTVLSKSDVNRMMQAVSCNRPIAVTGIQGSTGKSTLVKYLRELGVNAFEPFEVEEFTLDKLLI